VTGVCLVAGSGRAGAGSLSFFTLFCAAERHIGSERETAIDRGRGRGTGRVVDVVVTFSGKTECGGFVGDPETFGAASAE